ncbi:hypothetical protein PAP18089_00254 [Pandoraea apista]|uniref:Uncharacterized protein n=1 Tax=Pandoraea apista TaxID=93218 RepID=A0A5E5NYG8_9BURK|nr:hypothetical protein LMG16407_01900 [Pandoraea apista]VVG69301.1 hypothetical protein PAP18089_00254 [Pandoraea apista]
MRDPGLAKTFSPTRCTNSKHYATAFTPKFVAKTVQAIKNPAKAGFLDTNRITTDIAAANDLEKAPFAAAVRSCGPFQALLPDHFVERLCLGVDLAQPHGVVLARRHQLTDLLAGRFSLQHRRVRLDDLKRLRNVLP